MGISLSSVFLFGIACSNDESAASSCGAPNADGMIHELSGACRVGDEEEHIRLEGLSLESGQSVKVWAKADTLDGDNGISINITDTLILYINIDNPATFPAVSHGGITDGLLCFDLHYEESPIHALAWKGEERNRGSDGGMTLFNSETSGDEYWRRCGIAEPLPVPNQWRGFREQDTYRDPAF